MIHRSRYHGSQCHEHPWGRSRHRCRCCSVVRCHFIRSVCSLDSEHFVWENWENVVLSNTSPWIMVRRKCTTAPGHRWIGPWGQWNSNQNVKGFIQQNAFENVWTDAVPDLRRYMTLLGHTGLMPHLWNLCELSLIQPLNSLDTFAPACIFFKPDCMFWVKYIT